MKCLLFFTLVALMSFSEVKGQGCEPYWQITGHTMCIYKEKACPGANLIRSGDLTCEEKNEILSAHNKYRQMIANGEAFGQPPAADMSELVWDEELATIAQRWADQCTFGGDEVHIVSRFDFVGQNVAELSRDSTKPAPSIAEAAEAWFNQGISFYPENIEPFQPQFNVKGYTQLAWAETHRLGCGYSMYEKGDGITITLIVCNYGFAGNWIGGQMYAQGWPDCLAIPFHTPSPRYPGLCERAGSNPPGTGCTMTEYVLKPVENKPEIDQNNVPINPPKIEESIATNNTKIEESNVP